jgi:hypothetical protein
MPLKTTTFYLETATCFGLSLISPGHQHGVLKQYNILINGLNLLYQINARY